MDDLHGVEMVEKYKELQELQTDAMERFLQPEVEEFVKNHLDEELLLSDKYALAKILREKNDAKRIENWPKSIPKMEKIIDDFVINQDYPVPIRIYYPHEVASNAAILFVHGGGFMTQSIATDDGPARCLADNTKTIVIQLDYRLAPEHPWPVGYHDLLAVCRELLSKNNRWDIDSSKMVIMGESAGANLALNALIHLKDGPNFLAGIVICGTYQPTISTDSWNRYGNGEFLIHKRDDQFLLDCYYGEIDHSKNPEIWPIFADLRGISPLYIAMSSADPLRDDSLILANKLQELHQEYYLVEWVGLLHTGIIDYGKNTIMKNYLGLLENYITNILHR